MMDTTRFSNTTDFIRMIYQNQNLGRTLNRFPNEQFFHDKLRQRKYLHKNYTKLISVFLILLDVECSASTRLTRVFRLNICNNIDQ